MSRKKKVYEFQEDVRLSPEYVQGVRAYAHGAKSCPYKNGKSRMAWFTGYFDAQTRERLSHVFKTYGLQWP